jgi:hypothetical protein
MYEQLWRDCERITEGTLWRDRKLGNIKKRTSDAEARKGGGEDVWKRSRSRVFLDFNISFTGWRGDGDFIKIIFKFLKKMR